MATTADAHVVKEVVKQRTIDVAVQEGESPGSLECCLPWWSCLSLPPILHHAMAVPNPVDCHLGSPEIGVVAGPLVMPCRCAGCGGCGDSGRRGGVCGAQVLSLVSAFKQMVAGTRSPLDDRWIKSANRPPPVRPLWLAVINRFRKSLGISGKVGTVMMAVTGSFFLFAELVRPTMKHPARF